tara:strand:+ start:388 stop:501 length:114 start_codon:yes stop_codon:yes gene_type:complete
MNNIAMNRQHIKQTFAQILLSLGSTIWAIELLSQLLP